MRKTFLALTLVGALFSGAFAQVITEETNVLEATSSPFLSLILFRTGKLAKI